MWFLNYADSDLDVEANIISVQLLPTAAQILSSTVLCCITFASTLHIAKVLHSRNIEIL